MSGLTIGSLFTGAGMLDRAVEQVFGGRTVWVSDVDPGACAILAHRFPGVPNLGDVTTVDWSAVEPVDVICGGSPCQDVSHAGRRAGMTEGTRSNLWAAMREAIAALRPQLVIWENVDGAHSADADSALEPCPGCVGDRRGGAVLRALGRVLGDLASLGYDAQWVSLRAADVGACHGRRRVFVVAHAQGERRQWPGAAWDWGAGLTDSGSESLTLLPTPTSRDHKGHNQRRDETCLTGALLPSPWATRGGSATETFNLLPTPSVADGLGGHESRGGSRGNERLLPGVAKDIHKLTLLPTPTAGNFNDGEDPDQWEARRQRVNAATGNGNGMGTPLGIAVRLLPTPTTTDANGAGAPEGQGYRGVSLTDATVRQPARWGDYAAAIARHEALYGPAPDPTEPRGRGGAHRLSPAFAEWMMCLPSGWVTDPAIWEGWTPSAAANAQLRALGNGVVPPQATAATRWLLSVAASLAT